MFAICLLAAWLIWRAVRGWLRPGDPPNEAGKAPLRLDHGGDGANAAMREYPAATKAAEQEGVPPPARIVDGGVGGDAEVRPERRNHGSDGD